MWIQGGTGTCDDVCSQSSSNLVCSDSELSGLTDEAAAKAATNAAGITCTSWNGWDYGQGLSQCTSAQCCGGKCVGACSFPTTKPCSAKSSGSHQRICPCLSGGGGGGGEQNWEFCANEGVKCQCSGDVRFGKGSVWSGTKDISRWGSIDCSTVYFGDPLPKTSKECQCRSGGGGGRRRMSIEVEVAGASAMAAAAILGMRRWKKKRRLSPANYTAQV